MVIKCVKTCGFFSFDFEEKTDGLYFFVRTWDLNRVIRICVCVEPVGQPFPEAEINCLSRFLSCVGTKFRPLVISGVSSLVNSFYNDSNKKQGKLLSYVQYSPELFIEHVRKAGGNLFGLVDPFTLLEFLVWKLKPALNEPWLVPLTALRRCLLKSCIELGDLPSVLPELVSVWNLVREFIGSNIPKGVSGMTVEVICPIFLIVLSFLVFL